MADTSRQEHRDYLSIDRHVKELQPDWTNPPNVVDLKNDLNEAMPAHKAHINKVNEWLKALRGETNIAFQEGRSRVQPKLVRKQNEWRYSALEEPFLSTDDMFSVNPVTHEDVEPARQNQLILNKQFRIDIPKVDFINKFIRTAVNTGTVVIKLAWEHQIGMTREERMEPVFLGQVVQSEEDVMQFLQQLIQEGQLDEQTAMQLMETGQWQEIPVDEEKVVEEVEKTIINRPVIEIKDSRSVVIDPSCEGNFAKARFVIDRFLTDLSTLKKDGRYSNLEKIEEKEYDARVDADYNNEYREEANFRFQDKPRQKLVAHEYWGYWDINDDGIVVPIVATWIGDVMIRLDENPYPDKKLPFVVIQYLPPDTDVVYGDADASLLTDNQNIVGAVTRAIIDLIGRSANAQQGVRKDVLDPPNFDKFNKGLNFEYNPVANIQDAFFVTKMPEIPRSALEVIQLMNNEAEALTGVKAFSAGISGDALGSQVGGIRSALDATAKRELGILRRLSNGLIQTGRKIMSMNSLWLSDEEIIRVTDREFVAIKRDDLAGNFDLVLNVSTAEADNQKASELAFMLQTLGNSVPFEIVKIIMIKIAELRKLPDLAFALEQFEPQPDPLEVAKKEAEIDYIKANTQKDMSAADKNEAQEALAYAKAGQTGAQARKTESEADLRDLDYLEQSSGLKQDRDLEQLLVRQQANMMRQK